VIKSETDGSSIDQNFCFHSKPPSSFFNQIRFFLQLKNPLSAQLSYFQGTSPFWRPPPVF
jgi:hypothetical protein